jgi:hypothetical protein
MEPQLASTPFYLRRWFRLLLAGGILAAAAILLRGYVTDDTFIHLRYARHLLARGEFSFNPGQHTYGATSPLWIFMLALLLKLGLAPLAAAWWGGLLAGLGVLLLMDALLARSGWPASWQGVLLLLLAADAWFLRWTLSGMETPLATLLLLLLLWPVMVRRRPHRAATSPVGRLAASVPFWGWGVAAGLAGLARPEFALLGPLALPWVLWDHRRRAGGERVAADGVDSLFMHALAAGAGWLVAVGPWLVYAWGAFGRLLPETATAKSYALNFSPGSLSASVLRSLSQLAATQIFLWVAVAAAVGIRLWGRRGGGRAANVAAEPVTSGPPAAPGGAGRPCGSNLALCGIVIVWTGVLIGGYAVKQVWVVSRYLAPLEPPLLLAMAALVAGGLAPPTPELRPRRAVAAFSRRRVGLAILLAGCLAQGIANGWLLTARVRPHAREFSRGLRECYLGTGRWLRENSPPQAIVAALDIGAVGFASERCILDLMGLVSPELLDLGRRLGFEEMVASGAWLTVAVPDYLVDRTSGPPRWPGTVLHGVRFELLRTCVIEGVGLTEPQPWTIALYRLVPVSSGL